jgi:hypothetical protein
MESGVISRSNRTARCSSNGTANANGTTTSYVTITGVDNYSASIDAKGTLNFAFTDVNARVVPAATPALM